MSIFGKLDAATISTNPFWIEEGEYEAEVTNAEYRSNRDGQKQLHIEYTVTEEESRFDGNKANQYFPLMDADMTYEQFVLLPKDEQQKISRTNAALKKTLCGSDGNEFQKGLGIPQDDLNDENWDPAVLKGLKVRIGVNNYGKDNNGVNVRWVNLISE